MPNSDSANLGDLPGPLVLVGAGKMGGAMLQGWLRLGLAPANAVVFEPQPSAEITALGARGVRLHPQAATVPAAAAMLIAVKPQVAAAVIPPYAAMAGAAIVRAMPNT